MHPAQAAQDRGLGELVAEAAGQRQRLLVSGGCRRVVPGQRVQVAQTVEGMGPAGLVAQVAVERRSPGEAGHGRRVLSGQPFRSARVCRGPRLAGPVSCLTRRGEGEQVEGRGPIPVTVGAQEVACQGGYGDSTLVPAAAAA